MIHFLQDEIMWVCRLETKCQCECYGNVGYSTVFSATLHKNIRLDLSDRGEPQVTTLWRELVNEYSMRHLIFERYIFSAPQGFSKWFGHHRNTDYLSAVWKDTIIEDLLWDKGFAQYGLVTRTNVWRTPR